VVYVETSARYFEFYAGLADKTTGTTLPQAPGTLAYTLHEPYGVIGHITPWNSPLAQMCRGVAPSLAMGNTVVVKPSELTPLSSLYVSMLFIRAGLPSGVCNVVVGRGPTAGAALVEHPDVRRVSFTGSVATGRTVMEMAGRRIVPCNVELGGKSPTIVLADADLEAAANAGAAAVIRNSGQSCSATTRLLVDRVVHDQFVAMLAERMARLRIGHGLDNPDLGPLVSANQRKRVLRYIESAESEGAVVRRMGEAPTDTRGHFVMPVIVTGVRNDMTVAREEIFGPVQSVLPFDTEDEAIAIANDSPYGLAAGIFTKNLGAAHQMASRLEAGQVQVNRYPAGGVDTPFGGYKDSGIGREKGIEALRYYSQLKTVIVGLER
jgi:acyl-CoA reductase-like NAD-dependent aldehyde dehydrogenase